MKASDVLPRFYLGRFFSVHPLSVWRAGTRLECQFGELEGGAACSGFAQRLALSCLKLDMKRLKSGVSIMLP